MESSYRTNPGIVFFDFEASGSQGYPIESGWVEVNPNSGAEVACGTDLICPDPEWDHEYGWDWRAEDIHTIKRSDLDAYGKPYQEVAQDLVRRFGIHVPDRPLVVSDAPRYEQQWMDILLDAAGVPLDKWIKIVDISRAFEGQHIDEMRYEQAMRWKRSQIVRHRALADARLWAEVYRRSLRNGL